MVKSVYKGEELPHLFANNTQSYARNSSNSQHFDNNIYYSYRAPIAYRLVNSKSEQAIFFNNIKLSITTNKHLRKLQWACNHITSFDYTLNSYSTPTFQSLYSYYLNLEQTLLSDLKKSRRYKYYIATQIQDLLHTINKLVTWFDSDSSLLVDTTKYDALIENLLFIDKQKEEERTKKKLEQEAKNRLETKGDFDYWLSGYTTHFPSSWNSTGTYLRINPSDPSIVQTSRGATFPLSICKKLYTIYLNCKQNHSVFDKEFHIGKYTLNKITEDGITAGCHFIKGDEIERFASLLGYDKQIDILDHLIEAA